MPANWRQAWCRLTGLCCHIRLAVEEAHAERIGHGVDVMYEDRPYELLKEMAAKAHHGGNQSHQQRRDSRVSPARIIPLPIYRRFGVPVALSTDDEGVSRIDMTHEYVRAVETYGLRYADLKQMVRTSMEHSFLAGRELVARSRRFQSARRLIAPSDHLALTSPRCRAPLPATKRKGRATVGTRAALPRV